MPAPCGRACGWGRARPGGASGMPGRSCAAWSCLRPAPPAEPPLRARRPAPEPDPRRDAYTIRAMPSTVFIVDDEKNIRRTVRMVLEGEGYNVDEASSGEEALAR